MWFKTPVASTFHRRLVSSWQSRMITQHRFPVNWSTDTTGEILAPAPRRRWNNLALRRWRSLKQKKNYVTGFSNDGPLLQCDHKRFQSTSEFVLERRQHISHYCGWSSVHFWMPPGACHHVSLMQSTKHLTRNIAAYIISAVYTFYVIFYGNTV